MVQRRGYSEWVKLIEEFEKSASSLEDFAAKLGVNQSSVEILTTGARVAQTVDCKSRIGDLVPGDMKGAGANHEPGDCDLPS